MAKMEAHLDTYCASATDVMKRATEFETEIKIEKLMCAMHHCAYELANILTIMQMDEDNWNVGFSQKEIT